MAIYEREVRVDAPLDDVWAFHSRVEGLEELTPAWAGLRVESVVGPDGAPDPGVLEPGARIRMSAGLPGFGPRQSWTSVIAEREERDGVAYFVDEMVGGPFESWRHTHLFYAESDDRTLIRDRVRYELPFGAPAALGRPGLDMMFRARHRRTRERFSGL
ncbi:SRPBCC family protein [Salarchaeum sp. JOR-1]|uniref:SRPBCC family protein n=1 Tax=Salarchaeum sp. JOR-1 TaxID=2599399 RepID=UPI0011983579|nr:SRPBCC family protein [Salarchaeum sp. JOR-1]QDX40928.1 SRPBCC family protein [Salarchaeum sp. JOR-1]